MIRPMQNIWSLWLRVMTVAAAILALVLSVSLISPEVDHRTISLQSTAALAGVRDAIGDAATHPASDEKCHVGHCYQLVIIPSNGMAMTGLIDAQERPIEPHFKPFRVLYLLFHPPRILSQV
ncbi:MAG: hypothetical protein RIE24_10995 [Silicimonas sp.]